MTDDAVLQDTIRRGKPISAKRASALLTLQAELESQLGQAHELLTILRDAAAPAAAALFTIAQLPATDERIKQTIQQTLAPLDAALAATKGDTKDGK